MAQKVNPFGFRLGNSLNWVSSGINFALIQKIESYSKSFFFKQGFLLNSFQVKNKIDTLVLDIEVYPLPVPTKNVVLIETTTVRLYKKVVSFLAKKDINLNLVFLNHLLFNDSRFIRNYRDGLGFLLGVRSISSLLAQSVSIDLEKNRQHIKVLELYRAILDESFVFWKNNSKLKGCCIQVKGRINGSDRSRVVTIRQGVVSLNSITSKLDFSYKKSNTPFGLFGVKVWACYQKI